MFGLKAYSATLVASLVLTAVSAAKTSVTLSLQPTYWGLPPFIAKEKGFFDDLDLDVTFVMYNAGVEQIDSADSWDMGATGCVPAIYGGTLGVETIGVSNDESTANSLVATKAGFEQWPPESLEGVPFSVPEASTAHYAVEACLGYYGYNISEIQFDFQDTSGVLSALDDETSNYGGLWAPHTYTFLEKANFEGRAVVCSGLEASARIPGAIIVKQAFGEQNGDIVAKVLAAWIRAIDFISRPENKADTIGYMSTFYALNNIFISQDAMSQEINTRPLFELEKQIDLMTNDIPGWFTEIGEFMNKAGGLVETIPASEDYITASYMQMIKDDEVLRSFTNVDNPPPGTGTDPGTDTSAGAAFGWTMSVTVLAAMSVVGVYLS